MWKTSHVVSLPFGLHIQHQHISILHPCSFAQTRLSFSSCRQQPAPTLIFWRFAQWNSLTTSRLSILHNGRDNEKDRIINLFDVVRHRLLGSPLLTSGCGCCGGAQVKADKERTIGQDKQMTKTRSKCASILSILVVIRID